MIFPMAVIALDFGNVVFFLLRNNIGTCGRRVKITTLSPYSIVPGTSLVVLVFL